MRFSNITRAAANDPVTPGLSERIACVRVLAILGMVYVHVPGIEQMIASGSPAGFGAQFLIEGVGRASSALLAVVSGWLVATALLAGRSTPSHLILRRARTTLAPMAFWSAVTVLVYCAVSIVRPTFLSVPDENTLALAMRFVDTVFFLTSDPVGPTMHLSFLRDLFMCVVLAGLLLRALQWAPALVLVALGGVYVAQVPIYVVLRPLVLFGFAAGMSLALFRSRLDRLDRWLPMWLLGGCIATASIMLAKSGFTLSVPWTWPSRPPIDLLESVLYPAARLCWALVLWAATQRLIERPFARTLRQASPLIFVTFCTHFLSLTLIWFLCLEPLTAGMLGTPASAVLLVWFLCAPAIAVLVARVLIAMMSLLSPTLCALAGLGRRSFTHERTAASPAALV